MNRMKLGTMLLGAAAGGMVVNAVWYYRTSAFLKKRTEEEVKRSRVDLADASAVRLFANNMANIARDSKTMSKADKEKIEELRRLVWTKVDDETAMAIFDAIQKKTEEWIADGLVTENDEEKVA